MAKKAEQKIHDSVVKKTSQGGRNPKTAGMNKDTRRNHKPYRGQGR
jgi:hypothetical protein